MQRDPYGVCVATSTLEIGIDIGDIDSVVLHSPPFTVNAFLQRIGRGNRRSGTCRVLAVTRTEEEGRVYEALKTLAEEGHLDEVHEFTRPSVTFQQILSLTWRGLRNGRPLRFSKLQDEGLEHADEQVVKDMLQMGHLRLIGDSVIPSDTLLDEGDARRIHSVLIGSVAQPVTDSSTGDIVAMFECDADKGDYFLDGSVKGMSGSGEEGYLLERKTGYSGEAGRIPSASRGGTGFSRRLVWRIATLKGLDPTLWVLEKQRVLTWGGKTYNRILSLLLGRLGLLERSYSDDFWVGILRSGVDIDPKQILDWAMDEKTWSGMGLKELEPFRQPSRYYNLLSQGMRRQEALSAIPRDGFFAWIRGCRHESVEIQPGSDKF
jgi:ATP-dependent Lhr-like helicase